MKRREREEDQSQCHSEEKEEDQLVMISSEESVPSTSSDEDFSLSRKTKGKREHKNYQPEGTGVCLTSRGNVDVNKTAGTAVVSASAFKSDSVAVVGLIEDEHADDESSLEDTIDILEDEEEAETLAPAKRRRREAQAPEESTSLDAVEERDEEEAALQQALAMSVQEGTGAAGITLL